MNVVSIMVTLGTLPLSLLIAFLPHANMLLKFQPLPP
jgi:hypothetical protein